MAQMKSLTINDIKYDVVDATAISSPITATVGQTIAVKSVDENDFPTEWEAVDFPENGGSTNAIIDIVKLPKDNVSHNAFYRLTTAKFVSKYYVYVDAWKCYCVDGLPDVGEPVSTDMVNIVAYYNAQDGSVYGYADDTISATGGIPVGWYPIETLAQAFNIVYGGVITDEYNVDESSCYVLLNQDFYIYQNGWTKTVFGYEKEGFDIKWDGVIGDRFAIDMSALGYEAGTYFVKVSDDIITPQFALNSTIQIFDFQNSMVDEAIVEESSIDTQTYAGAVTFYNQIISIYSADDLAAAVGLPAGYLSNGTYFLYVDGAVYVSRLFAPTKITKIDKRYLPDDEVDPSIIDVIELPIDDIIKNKFYRLMTGSLVSNQEIVKSFSIHIVETLPEVGLLAINSDLAADSSVGNVYYCTSDGEAYGYVDANGVDLSVGWHDCATLFSAFGITYSGVITDIEDDPCDDSSRILLNYDYYTYKNNKWIKMIFAEENTYKYDIVWNGDMTNHSTLESGDGVYFVKVSDEVIECDELIGAVISITNSDGVTQTATTGYSLWIDDALYTGAIAMRIQGSPPTDIIMVVYNAEALAASLGIPTGIYTNGIYFYYTADAYISRLTTKNFAKIKKIDGKYLDVDLTSYAKASDLTSYAKASDLTSYAKASEVESMIAEAISGAIGGSY